jgi:hypothetical protein
MEHPPQVQGRDLWEPLDASLPDLNNPYWRAPLDLANFRYPYAAMDMPTAQPSHEDATPKPTLVHRFAVLGIPNMVVQQPIVVVNVRPGESATPAEVRISNSGSGIVAWRVTANKPWVTVSQVAGIAVGDNLPCLPSSPCDRAATLQISVDPDRVLGSDAAVVTIRGIGHGGRIHDVAVFVRANVAIGIPGTTRN